MHCLLSIFCCVFSRLWTWWKKRVRIYSFLYKSFLSQGLFGGNTRPQRLTCSLLTNSPSERQTKATNKMSGVTQTEMTSLQSRRLFLPVISTCVTVILLIGWWGPPAFHQSKSNTNLVLTTGRGQGNHFTGCEPKTKDAETLCNVSFDLFFYSKIGPFTCKSNAFAEEYEKRDTTMALKEIYILQKGIEKHSNENLSFSAHFLSFVTTYTIN